MGQKMSRRLRRYGIRAVVAIIPTAMVAMMATNLLAPTDLLAPTARPVSLDIIPTAVIVEDSSTIGFADSDLYGLSKPDGSLDEAAVLRTLDAMQALGVNEVRVLIPWAFVEPVPNDTPFNPCPCWDRNDFIINAANERGMGVLGVITATPVWGIKQGSGGFGYSASPDVAAYTAFAAATAARYAGQVSAYEVGNEPNSIVGWTPNPDPVAYTELLKSAYTAIKAADPTTKVVGGVLVAGLFTFPGFTLNPVDFVSQMYANGAKGYFDALSIHPYQYTTEFSQGGYSPVSPISQLIAIRQLMIANGDEALRIWATEYGLPTSGPSGVSEQVQADFIKDFLETWAATDYAGPAYIYTTRDQVGFETTENGSFGVYTSDWQEKLAAKVIKAILNPDVPPTDPTDPGQAIADALNAIFQQLANAYAQAFAAVAQAAVTAYVNALAQAITDALGSLFANLALPATQQDAIVEGVSAARMNVASLKVDPDASVVTSLADVDGKAALEANAPEASAAGAPVAGSEVVDGVLDTTEPVTPTTLTEPTTPATSTEQATPAKPTEPTTPAKPTEPTTPAKPTEPTTPAKPTEQATPAKPTEPRQPADEDKQTDTTQSSDTPKPPKEKADASSTDTHSRLPRKWRTRGANETNGGNTSVSPSTGARETTDGHGSPPATPPSTAGEASGAPAPAVAGAGAGAGAGA